MKTKNILLIFFLLVTQAVVAQIMFQRHYGGVENDGGSSVLQTDDGGYLIAGHTETIKMCFGASRVKLNFQTRI